jgi:hypothetical protein
VRQRVFQGVDRIFFAQVAQEAQDQLALTGLSWQAR